MNKLLSTKIMLPVIILTILCAYMLAGASTTSKKILLTANNTISLNQAINGESVSNVISQARALDSRRNKFPYTIIAKDPIYLVLRTPGGDVQMGLEMLEALKGLNRPIHTITIFSASMGFQTTQQLGTRYILKNGVLMSHRARGQFQGEFGGLLPSQLDNRKNLWERRIEEMDAQTVQRTNGKQTLLSYQTAYSSELWLTGQEAVDKGYADETVLTECDESLSGASTYTADTLFGLRLSYDLDNCPLNSSPVNVRALALSTNKGLMNFDSFKAKSGEFGSSCLIASGVDVNKICALDTNLNLEKIVQLQNQFKQDYINIQNRIIPLAIPQ